MASITTDGGEEARRFAEYLTLVQPEVVILDAPRGAEVGPLLAALRGEGFAMWLGDLAATQFGGATGRRAGIASKIVAASELAMSLAGVLEAAPPPASVRTEVVRAD